MSVCDKLARKICLVILSFALSACTHSVHLISFSEFSPTKKTGKPVRAATEQFVVMGFTSETNYVDDAYRSLAQQCSGGEITGIATKYYTSHGFFSWTNHVVMEGTCI